MNALILGIDPSSGARADSATGLVLLSASLSGRPVLLHYASCHPSLKHKDTFTECGLRVKEMHRDAAEWLSHADPVDACGIEWPWTNPETTNAAQEALLMACGAILSAVNLSEGGKLYKVHVGTAKAIYGAGNMKRDDAKRAVVAWAKREYSLPDMDPVSLEAVADALAVAVVTVNKWRADEMLKAQGSLFARARRPKKEAVR